MNISQINSAGTNASALPVPATGRYSWRAFWWGLSSLALPYLGIYVGRLSGGADEEALPVLAGFIVFATMWFGLYYSLHAISAKEYRVSLKYTLMIIVGLAPFLYVMGNGVLTFARILTWQI